MKYIIDIPDDSINKYVSLYNRESFVVPITVGLDSSLCFNTGLKLKPYTEPDRKAIEDAQEEVWNFARKIILSVSLGGLTTDEIRDCFGNDNVFFDVLRDFSYQEAKAKYDAWKQETDQKIALWDEVIDEEEDRLKGIVVFILGDTIDILYEDGSVCSDRYIKDFTKTGRRFPQVAEMLKAMKGAE